MFDIQAAKKRCEKYLTAEEQKSLATWLHRDDYFGATELSDDIQAMYRLAAALEALEEAEGALRELCRRHNSRGSDGPCDCVGCRILSKEGNE